ncbi:hypothetical protein CWC39_09710 [Corynebacterium heidelbergense]|uniref:Uncharacterized protein n=1 Tax=Corynebacterium heidelbergense TaxID=2055947 RepID=A0A364V977_9CORY|nr:hypothetical protein CWC39_09710 [Corynebacterium heidelbergense]
MYPSTRLRVLFGDGLVIAFLWGAYFAILHPRPFVGFEVVAPWAKTAVGVGPAVFGAGRVEEVVVGGFELFEGGEDAALVGVFGYAADDAEGADDDDGGADGEFFSCHGGVLGLGMGKAPWQVASGASVGVG